MFFRMTLMSCALRFSMLRNSMFWDARIMVIQMRFGGTSENGYTSAASR